MCDFVSGNIKLDQDRENSSYSVDKNKLLEFVKSKILAKQIVYNQEYQLEIY